MSSNKGNSKNVYSRDNLVVLRESVDSSQELSWRLRGAGKDVPKKILVSRDEMGSKQHHGVSNNNNNKDNSTNSHRATNSGGLSDWGGSRTSTTDVASPKQPSSCGGGGNLPPGSTAEQMWVYRTLSSAGVVSEPVRWSEVMMLIDEGLVDQTELEVKKVEALSFETYEEVTSQKQPMFEIPTDFLGSSGNSALSGSRSQAGPPPALGSVRAPPQPVASLDDLVAQDDPSFMLSGSKKQHSSGIASPCAIGDDPPLPRSNSSSMNRGPGAVAAGVPPPAPLGVGESPPMKKAGAAGAGPPSFPPMALGEDALETVPTQQQRAGGAGAKGPAKHGGPQSPAGGKVIWGGKDGTPKANAQPRRVVPKVVPVTTRNDLNESEFPSLDSLA